MANVRAAAAESKKIYKAYVSANILENKKIFSIPVFKNMPDENVTREDYFKASKPTLSASASTTSITLSWTGIDYAEKYQIYKYDDEAGEYIRVKTTSLTSYANTSVVKDKISKYKVRAYYIDDENKKIYSSYSAVIEVATAPDNIAELNLVKKTENSIEIEWPAIRCTGYTVYRYDAVVGDYVEVDSTTLASYIDNNIGNGVFRYKIRSYTQTSSGKYYSENYSPILTVVIGQNESSLMGKVNLTDGYLNIRASASISSNILAQLPKNFEVIILDLTGDWYKVTFSLDGKTITGYAYKDYIKVNATEPNKEACPYVEPTTTLRQGNTGESVKWLQWHLYKLGYLTKDDVDGDFGPKTFSVSKQFQADWNLDVDGVVGPATRSALKTAYEKSDNLSY
jgi:fibronectin type 3 domain-containing protein